MKVRNLILVTCVVIVLAMSAGVGFAQEVTGDGFYSTGGASAGVVYGDGVFSSGGASVGVGGNGWADIGYGFFQAGGA